MAVIAAMSLTMTSCDGDDYWYDPYGWYDHYMTTGDGTMMIGTKVSKVLRTILCWRWPRR